MNTDQGAETDPSGSSAGSARPWFEAWAKWYERVAAASGAQAAGMPPWQEAMQAWWKGAAPALPDGQREIFNRFFTQALEFMRLGAAVQGYGDPGAGGQGDRFAQMSDFSDFLQQRFADYAATVMGPAAGLDTLVSAAERWNALLESAAPVGIARERLAEAGRGARLLREHRAAAAAYTQVFQDIAADALVGVRARLLDAAREGTPLRSVRALYGVWVDCCEAAYAKHVLTDDYAVRFARYLNTGLALKHHLQRATDALLAAQNLPNRTEIDALHHRIRTLEAELAGLRTERAAAGRPANAEPKQAGASQARRSVRSRARPAVRSGRNRKSGGKSKERSVSKPTRWDIANLIDGDGGTPQR